MWFAGRIPSSLRNCFSTAQAQSFTADSCGHWPIRISSDAAARLGFEPRCLIRNHGAERWGLLATPSSWGRMGANGGLNFALVVGDDSNDEPAFLKATPGSVTVRIGSMETPTAARFALEFQTGIDQLLDVMRGLRTD